MTSRVAHLADRSVRYITTGPEASPGRPTLVLIHAFPLSADQWLPQLVQGPAGWRVVAPDLRGFRGPGSSSEELAPDGMSIDRYAADVFALMDHLEIGNAVVAGVSMGGYVAFGMLRQAPGRVAGLVLANTRASADTPEGRANRDRMIDLVRREGADPIARAMLPKLLGATTFREQRDLVEVVGHLIRANTAEAIAAALGALRDRPDSTPMLASIACPTLVVTGDEDAIIPHEESQAMHAAIKGARLVVLPHTGHLGNLEDPNGFNRAVTEFLSGSAATPAG